MHLVNMSYRFSPRRSASNIAGLSSRLPMPAYSPSSSCRVFRTHPGEGPPTKFPNRSPGSLSPSIQHTWSHFRSVSATIARINVARDRISHGGKLMSVGAVTRPCVDGNRPVFAVAIDQVLIQRHPEQPSEKVKDRSGVRQESVLSFSRGGLAPPIQRCKTVGSGIRCC